MSSTTRSHTRRNDNEAMSKAFKDLVGAFIASHSTVRTIRQEYIGNEWEIIDSYLRTRLHMNFMDGPLKSFVKKAKQFQGNKNYSVAIENATDKIIKWMNIHGGSSKLTRKNVSKRKVAISKMRKCTQRKMRK